MTQIASQAGYPDLLVFRGDGAEVMLDILGRHLDFGDAVARAKGLARFARDYRARIGGDEMLRKPSSSSGMLRLRLDDPEIAAAVLDQVTSSEDLVHLFQAKGTRSQY